MATADELQAMGPDEFPRGYYEHLADNPEGDFGQTDPMGRGEDTNAMLADFLVWLGGQRLLQVNTRVDGVTVYGPGMIPADKLLELYWGTYQ